MLIAGYALMCKLKVNTPLNHSFSLNSSSPLPQVPEPEGRTDALQASPAVVGLNIVRAILPVLGSLMLFLRVSLTGHPTSSTKGSPGRS